MACPSGRVSSDGVASALERHSEMECLSPLDPNGGMQSRPEQAIVSPSCVSLRRCCLSVAGGSRVWGFFLSSFSLSPPSSAIDCLDSSGSRSARSEAAAMITSPRARSCLLSLSLSRCARHSSVSVCLVADGLRPLLLQVNLFPFRIR